jgi:hypothetical protein
MSRRLEAGEAVVLVMDLPTASVVGTAAERADGEDGVLVVVKSVVETVGRFVDERDIGESFGAWAFVVVVGKWLDGDGMLADPFGLSVAFLGADAAVVARGDA